jgi:proline iminopeptidase
MRNLFVTTLLMLSAVFSAPGQSSNVKSAQAKPLLEFPVAEGYFSGADGARLFYRKVGNGKDIFVLLHGGPGGNMNSVWPDLESLAKRHAILMYDQRGGGRSTIIKDAARLTAAQHVRDLEALRQHFRLKRLTLIGESWGAGLAALYAAKHPGRVSRLLLLGPMPPTKALATKRFDQVNESTDFYKRLAELRQAMPKATDPIALCREMFGVYLTAYFFDQSAMSRRRSSSCNAPPEAVRNYLVVNDATFASLKDWDFLGMLAKLQQPTLIVEGEQSASTVASVRAWAKAMPNARLLLIANAGHFPQVEQPEVFFPAVEKFLRGGWPVGAKPESKISTN